MDILTGVKVWLAIKPVKRIKQALNKRRARKGKPPLTIKETEVMNEQFASVIRSIIKVAGGGLVTNGLVAASDLEILAGAVAIGLGMLWSWYSKRKEAEV